MEVVKDTTQHLSANISQERLGKARLDFGNAGEVLGETAAFVYNQNRQVQQQQQAQSVPQFQFDTALPELQQAPKVDARKDQRDLEDLVRAKNNGAITDAQFQKSVTDIQDRMYYSGNFTPNEIKSLLKEVPGYSDMAKEINTGYFTAERQGANEATKEARKNETAKDIEIAQTVLGVDTNLPMWKQAEMGHTYRREQELVAMSPDQIKEISRGSHNLEVAYQQEQKISLVSILNATANSIYRAGVSRGASKQEVYRAIHEGVFATVQQYGKNPMVVQDLIDAVLDPFKKYSEGDLTAQKQINESLEAEKQGRASRQYIAADNISKGALTAANNARAMGLDPNLDPEMKKEITQALQTANDIGQFPAMSNESTQQLLLSYARNGDKVADDNVDLAVARLAANETGKQTNEADTKTVAKSGNEYLKMGNKVLLKELAEKGKTSDKTREAVKQTLANVLQAKVAAYRPRLTKDFSLEVDATGNIIVLKAGQADSPTVVGRIFETDSAEAEALKKEVKESVSQVPALELSRQELQDILPEINGTAPTTMETVTAVAEKASKASADVFENALKAVGDTQTPEQKAETKKLTEDLWGTPRYTMKDPTLADLFENFLGAISDGQPPEQKAKIKKLTDELFGVVRETTDTESFGGDVLMSAPLEAEETGAFFGDGNIDLNDRKVVLNDDGTFSTEESITISEGDLDVLIPTIVDGKKLKDEEAITHYEKTGEYLKKGTPEEVEEYANALHERQAEYYKDVAKRLLWQKNIEGRYTGVVKTGGKIPKGATLLSGEKPRKTALDQRSINKNKPAFKADVDKIVEALGNQDILVKVKTLSDGKKTEVAVPPELGLVVLGEGFTSGISKSNTIGFGTKINVAKPLLSMMGVKLDKDTKITHEQGVGLARLYIENTVDSKIKKVIGEEAFNNLDPVRRMLARDVLFAYGPSSVNFNGYKKVGLDQYFLNILDDTKSISDILKYKPTFPPFKDKLNGVRTTFYAPYGTSRLALIELFAENITGEKGGK